MCGKIKALFFSRASISNHQRLSNDSLYSLLADASDHTSNSRIVMIVGLPRVGKSFMIKKFLEEYQGEAVVVNAREDDDYQSLPNCIAQTTFDTKEFIRLARNRLVIVEDLPILARKSGAIKDISAFMSVYGHHGSSLILVSQTIDEIDSHHLRFIRALVIFRSNLSYRKLLNLLPTKTVARNVVDSAKLLNPRECFMIDLDSMTRTKPLPNNDAHKLLGDLLNDVQQFPIPLTKLKKNNKKKEPEPPKRKLTREIYKRLKDKPKIEWDYSEIARELGTTYKYVKVAVYRLRKQGLLP